MNAGIVASDTASKVKLAGCLTLVALAVTALIRVTNQHSRARSECLTEHLRKNIGEHA